MTEESPSRGDSSSRDHSSDAATSTADRGAAQDKGKGVAHGSQEGRDGDGGPAASEGAGGSDQDESEEEEGEEQDSDDDDDDEEDEEPKLKYARLTQHLGPVYRNGDATSAFLVAGDKMVPHLLPRPHRRNADNPTRSLDPIMEIL